MKRKGLVGSMEGSKRVRCRIVAVWPLDPARELSGGM